MNGQGLKPLYRANQTSIDFKLSGNRSIQFISRCDSIKTPLGFEKFVWDVACLAENSQLLSLAINPSIRGHFRGVGLASGNSLHTVKAAK